ncbi:MAG: S1-like domain-containing RNA-binding protein [Myxococcota bacterium]|nr:S1-like domain-containing RNA-binding protein [Myxococcota bacterium]
MRHGLTRIGSAVKSARLDAAPDSLRGVDSTSARHRVTVGAMSSVEDLLGRFATVTIRRLGAKGAWLALSAHDEGGSLPLAKSEVPEGAKEGDTLHVFVHLDGESRPIATTRTPKLERGQVVFLDVTACTSFGAFVDWGLPKELLVPFAEQIVELRPGQRHAIGLYVDKNGRLAGTTRVSETLTRGRVQARADEWVDGEAWRNDPDIGLFVIVERSFVGLVPASEPHTMKCGDAARFRVSNVLADGKVELSLRGHAHEELEQDARNVFEILARPGAPRIGDRSSPEEVRAVFGLSKKAFKRAVGRLLKQRAMLVDADGFLVRASPDATGHDAG